jgi:hypothetical protein
MLDVAGSCATEAQLTAILSSCFVVLFSKMAWLLKEVFDLGKQVKVSGGEEAMEEVFSASTELESKIQELLALRERVVAAALHCMEDSSAAATSGNGRQDASQTAPPWFVRQRQLQGFRTISNIRTLFPQRQSGYFGIDKLAYAPSAEVVNRMRMVFEAEEARVQQALEGADDESSPEVKRGLLENLLLPLSRSLIFDVEHINRRQTAAVLKHIVDPDAAVQEVAKSVARRLKEASLVKCMEVQLVVLKSAFQDDVPRFATEATIASQSNSPDFDFNENERAMELGYERLQQLAKKLSTVLGEEIISTLQGFLRAGVGFVVCLTPFVRFLADSDLRNTLAVVEGLMERHHEVTSQLQPSSDEHKRLTAFLQQLHSKAGMPSTSAPTRRLSARSSAGPAGRSSARQPRDSDSFLSDQLQSGSLPRGSASKMARALAEEEDEEDVEEFEAFSPAFQPPILGTRPHRRARASSSSSAKRSKFLPEAELDDIQESEQEASEDEIEEEEEEEVENISNFMQRDDSRKRKRTAQPISGRSPFHLESSPIEKSRWDNIDELPSSRRYKK